MKNKLNVKAITYGGIFATIYLIMTLLSIYVIPILSVFGLMIMPIFAAYYASVFKSKHIITFNLSTLIICFIAGISDPFFSLLYILPTLIIGDLFGILNKLKLKLYTTIFLQSIAYSITNLLALYLGEWLYDTQIIRFIINDPWVYENLSLVILYILSGAEAIFSSIFINEQLKRLNLFKEKEKTFPIYGYIIYCVLFILVTFVHLFSKNVFYLLIAMSIILAFPQFIEINKKIKHPNFVWIPLILIYAIIDFYLCYKGWFYLIPIILLLPLFVYCIVKISIYIYNINTKRQKGD